MAVVTLENGAVLVRSIKPPPWSICHWNEGGVAELTATLNVVLSPSQIVLSTGCEVMTAGVVAVKLIFELTEQPRKSVDVSV